MCCCCCGRKNGEYFLYSIPNPVISIWITVINRFRISSWEEYNGNSILYFHFLRIIGNEINQKVMKQKQLTLKHVCALGKTESVSFIDSIVNGLIFPSYVMRNKPSVHFIQWSNIKQKKLTFPWR